MSARDKAIAALAAVKIGADVSTSHSHAYYAEETQTWWLVTEDALARLGERLKGAPLDAVYDNWAESDQEAVEYGRRQPRAS